MRFMAFRPAGVKAEKAESARQVLFGQEEPSAAQASDLVFGCFGL
jgi:hypothetical protein